MPGVFNRTLPMRISKIAGACAIELAVGEKEISCLQRVIGFVQDAGN
jgi:hypothetical protein